MHRVPQIARVNWGGLPPHLEHRRSKAVREMIRDVDRRRDEYAQIKEIRNGAKE